MTPRSCVGCGAETVTLCAQCIGEIDQPVITSRPRFGTRTVAASGVYDGALRDALLAYKEHGRRDLTRLLGLLLARAVIGALDLLEVSDLPLVLVPVPSSPRAIRRRGMHHVEELARIAAGVLAVEGMRTRVAGVLRVRSHFDQVGLGALQRQRNVRDSHWVHRDARSWVGHWSGRVRLIVVDDIVTTGSTLAEACRALQRAQAPPDGCATVGIARDQGRTEGGDVI